MAGVAVHVATTEGHDGFPPTTSVGGSDYITVDGKPVIVVGTQFVQHCDNSCHTQFVQHCNDSCHTPVAIEGSDYISINGIAVCEIGSLLDCGDRIATGSDFVTIG